MCPITAIGRIIACLCGLSGAATVGMLVSVLVDRYQRVYNRKMYISEPEMSEVDFDMISNPDDDAKSTLSVQKSGLIRNLSGVITRRFSFMQDKTKHDSHQSYNYQFLVSFNNNNKDPSATDQIVTTMKKKLTEAISTADIDVNLKLIDSDRQELWTISSSDSVTNSTLNLTLSTNTDDEQQTRIGIF